MGHWYPTEWCEDSEPHPEHLYTKNGTRYACFGKSAPQAPKE